VPLGHVERVRERRDDLELANLARSTPHEFHLIFIGNAVRF
jgi:hypothetical protein